MSTSYSQVYDLNNVIKKDSRLQNLDACELNTLCFEYLKFAISYFMYDCRKNLEDRTDPVYSSYGFTGDGSEAEFLLSPQPSDGAFLVVYVNGDTTDEYTYDDSTYIVTLNTAPSSGESVVVKTYTIGEFTDDLDIRELNILAEGMIIPYMSESKNNEAAMSYIISGSSLRFFSQANHINAMNSAVNSQAYNTVDSLISEYSYKGNTASYRGLAGRGGAV